MTDYFAFLGVFALALALYAGTSKRTGDQQHDWTLALFALSAWRVFLGIALALGVYFLLAWVLVSRGWIHW